MEYIDLTPKWREILPTWKAVVENCNSCKRNHRNHYNKTMSDFWNEIELIAQCPDDFNTLVAYVRNMEDWTDHAIKTALDAGRRYQERERNTIKESQS